MENDNRANSLQQREATFIPAAESRESWLAKLDGMEQELEKTRNEAPPHTPPPSGPDRLDVHEEILKSIALKLDTLLADLLEAEVREYICPEFPSLDKADLSWKSTTAARSGSLEKQRSVQEILVIAILIAAVFLVGMTFGLWGSFFFGL